MTYSLLNFIASLCLLVLPLTACGEKGLGKDEVPVSVAGVNYTDREISGYLFFNPANEKDIAGGEGINPYGAGGIMCCYALPRLWRPGIKVGLMVDNLNGYGERMKTVIELPPYPDGKAGDLWAIVYPDGSLGAVSTNYGPGHEKWPGKFKGWPVPSVEYKRMLWDRKVEEKISEIRLWSVPTENTAANLTDQWSFYSRLTRKETLNQLKKFSGPNDPAFFEFLEMDRKRMLDAAKTELEDLKKNRP